VYGVPKVFCAITRSADMNRTPDVRTRAILPEWACRFTVRFEKPILRDQTIADLLQRIEEQEQKIRQEKDIIREQARLERTFRKAADTQEGMFDQ
jgi:hypothetical protein